jgi:Family of unknown function (DUF5681)
MSDTTTKPKPSVDPNAPGKLSDDVVQSIKRAILHGAPDAPSVTDTRFRKGQSGNPTGRPRCTEAQVSLAEQCTKSALLAQGRRKITVTDNGKSTAMSAVEAVGRAQLKTALGGNAMAQARYLARQQSLELEEAEEIQRTNDAGAMLQQEGYAALAAAKAAGMPESEIVPHPDDFVFMPGKRFVIRGPVLPNDPAKYETYCRIRDTLILQAAMETDKTKEQTALVLMQCCNVELPKRMQLDTITVLIRFGRFRSRPRREQLKLVREAWISCGAKAKRSFNTPTMAFFEDCLNFVVEDLKRRRASAS